jgi:hypothetical protein
MTAVALALHIFGAVVCTMSELAAVALIFVSTLSE